MKRYILIILFFLQSTIGFSQIRYDLNNEQQIAISYTNPKTYEVAEIEVIGEKYLDEIALKSLSGIKVGDNISIPGEAISGAINKLWKQGIIGDIKIVINKIEDEKVYLSIVLKERPRLSTFNITGIGRTQKTELSEKINLIRGRIVTDAVLKNTQNIIETYFKKKGFYNVDVAIKQELDTIVANSIKLDINIAKNKKVKIDNISFEGNTNYSDAKLKGKLKKSGERVRVTLFKEIFNRTLSLINPKNLFGAKNGIKPNDVIEFVTDNAKINILKSSKFITSELENDKENLISFYQSKGYRDIKFLDEKVIRNGDYIDLKLSIDPGNRYYFRNINWTGNYIYDEGVLNEVLGIKPGDIYDTETLEKKITYNPNGSDVSGLYQDNGYLFSNIQPIEVGIVNDSVDIEMRVYEGAQATINKILIKGNDRTSDHVIRRELRTIPGQKYNRSELIRTQRELSQLGYFDPENINPIPVPNPQNETVDITWEVEEKPSDQVELSGGWGGYFGFVGTVGLSFSNFSVKNIKDFSKWRPLPVGDGQKLSVRVQANGRQFQTYSFTFSEPWLGGRKPNNFSINYSYSVNRMLDFFGTGGYNPYGGYGGYGGLGGYGGYGGYGGLGGYGGYGGYGYGGYGYNGQSSKNSKIIGSMKVHAVTIGLGRRIVWPDDFFIISNSLLYYNYDLFNFGQSLGFDTGVTNTIAFKTNISRNSVDNPMFPRSGSMFSLDVAITPPYSKWNNLNYETAEPQERYKWAEYHKWMFDSKFYTRIIGDLILESRAHFGYIGAYGDENKIGPFERFYLGGDGLSGSYSNFLLGTERIALRGYENNSLVPLDMEKNIRGGTIYNKFVFELRHPISLNPNATIFGLTFVEAGNNWNSQKDFNPFELYRSAGLGVRIFMPAFGLLGIDWGYGFDKLPGQPNRSGPQFHFSIGQQLR